MASPNPPSGLPFGGSDGDEVKTALIIAALVIGFLIALVVVRFGCDIFIDVCILNEPGRARRSIAELWRKIFPCWHRRTVPEVDRPSQDQELSSFGPEGRAQLLCDLLHSKTLTVSDLETMRGENVSSADDEHMEEGCATVIVCSICLHGLNEGDEVMTANCKHLWHSYCIREWICSSRTDCPNCRTEFIPEPELRSLQANLAHNSSE